jgi:hypothetical protein
MLLRHLANGAEIEAQLGYINHKARASRSPFSRARA